MDSSSWHRAYCALNAILNDQYDYLLGQDLREYTRDILIRDKNERYCSWMVAALTPWTAVAHIPPAKSTTKRPLPRPAMVARDALRCDNKIMDILAAAANHHQTVSDLKSSFVKGELCGSLADTRWRIAGQIRKMGSNWRICVIQAILLEIMSGANVEHGKYLRAPSLGILVSLVSYQKLTRFTMQF